jgi:transmembrane 9 superfamily protein 2/4
MNNDDGNENGGVARPDLTKEMNLDDHDHLRKLSQQPSDLVVVQNEHVLLLAHLVTSNQTAIPYHFYGLPGCLSPVMSMSRELPIKITREMKRYRDGSLSSILFGGETTSMAPFQIRARDQPCTTLCHATLESQDIRRLRKLIQQNYRIHFSLNGDQVRNSHPVGFMELAPTEEMSLAKHPYKYGFYNHLHFRISYVEDSFGGIEIADLDVLPVSVAHQSKSNEAKSSVAVVDTCDAKLQDGTSLLISNQNSDSFLWLPRKVQRETIMPVFYSYQVEWVRSKEDPTGPHANDSLSSSTLIRSSRGFGVGTSLLLGVAIACFVKKKYHHIRENLLQISAEHGIELQSLTRELDMENSEKSTENTSCRFLWPSLPPRLCQIVGLGAQIGSTLLITFSILPIFRDPVFVQIIFVFVCCGFVTGLVSAGLQKLFANADILSKATWKSVVTSTIPLMIGMAFVVVRTILLTSVGAATTVRLRTFLGLGILAGLQVPVVFVGTFTGRQIQVAQFPVRLATAVDRFQSIFSKSSRAITCSSLLCGLVPVFALHQDFVALLPAAWNASNNQGLRFESLWTLFMVALVCSESCILITCLQWCYLRGTGRHLWWTSFCNGASVGLFSFLYNLYLIHSQLDLIGLLSNLLCWGTNGLLSLSLIFFCGAIGFASTFVCVCFFCNSSAGFT